MYACFPSSDTLRTALWLAMRAPSVHNSQPWRWRIAGQSQSLHLFADPCRHLPHTDPDRRDLLLSCGASLHHAAVALAALGWHPTVHRFPDPADADHLAAVKVDGRPASELDVKLAAAIPRRRTDRRLYSRWPVALADIGLLHARATRAGVILRQTDAHHGLQQIVAQAVRWHASDPGYHGELMAWSGRAGSTDGVPARNTPRCDPTAPLPARIFADPGLDQPPGATSADDRGIVVALGTTDDSPLAHLRAGEATSLVLLTATALGLASCPLTEPLEVGKTRLAVQRDLFGSSAFPQMLLRIGWAPVDADPLPPTPRRPLDEVVNFGTATSA